MPARAMNFELQNFFVGLMDFFSILLPGALLTYLLADQVGPVVLGDRSRREGPRNPRALFRFGWILAYTGEIAEAEALYRDLVVLDRGGIYQA